MEKFKITVLQKIIGVVWFIVMVEISTYGVLIRDAGWNACGLIGALLLLVLLIVKIIIHMDKRIRILEEK